MSKKMEEVKEGNIRVVSEDFLQDVGASAKSFQELVSAHLLSPWGAAVKEEPEPAEVTAPKGKSAAAGSKKSKAPVKEEGEACAGLGGGAGIPAAQGVLGTVCPCLLCPWNRSLSASDMCRNGPLVSLPL